MTSLFRFIRKNDLYGQSYGGAWYKCVEIITRPNFGGFYRARRQFKLERVAQGEDVEGRCLPTLIVNGFELKKDFIRVKTTLTAVRGQE